MAAASPCHMKRYNKKETRLNSVIDTRFERVFVVYFDSHARLASAAHDTVINE